MTEDSIIIEHIKEEDVCWVDDLVVKSLNKFFNTDIPKSGVFLWKPSFQIDFTEIPVAFDDHSWRLNAGNEFIYLFDKTIMQIDHQPIICFTVAPAFPLEFAYKKVVLQAPINYDELPKQLQQLAGGQTFTPPYTITTTWTTPNSIPGSYTYPYVDAIPEKSTYINPININGIPINNYNTTSGCISTTTNAVGVTYSSVVDWANSKQPLSKVSDLTDKSKYN